MLSITCHISHITYHMSNVKVKCLFDPWYMLNNFCFHVYAQKSLFIAENCNVLFFLGQHQHHPHLFIVHRVHRAGSQLKIKLKTIKWKAGVTVSVKSTLLPFWRGVTGSVKETQTHWDTDYRNCRNISCYIWYIMSIHIGHKQKKCYLFWLGIRS